MNATTITITTDQKIKQRAQEAAKKLGTSVETILLDILLELAESKKKAPSVITETSHSRLTPTPYLEKILKKAEDNEKKGKVSPSFKTAKDAIAYLHKQTE